MSNGSELVKNVQRYMDGDGEDMPLSSEDIQKVAKEVIKQWKEITIHGNKVDMNTGKETLDDWPIREAMGATMTYSARACRYSKVAEENTD